MHAWAHLTFVLFFVFCSSFFRRWLITAAALNAYKRHVPAHTHWQAHVHCNGNITMHQITMMHKSRRWAKSQNTDTQTKAVCNVHTAQASSIIASRKKNEQKVGPANTRNRVWIATNMFTVGRAKMILQTFNRVSLSYTGILALCLCVCLCLFVFVTLLLLLRRSPFGAP